MNCDRCDEPLIEIDHQGDRLLGCIECNCWRGGKSEPEHAANIAKVLTKDEARRIASNIAKLPRLLKHS